MAGEAAGVAKLATNPWVRGSTPARLEFVLEQEISIEMCWKKIVLKFNRETILISWPGTDHPTFFLSLRTNCSRVHQTSGPPPTLFVVE